MPCSLSFNRDMQPKPIVDPTRRGIVCYCNPVPGWSGKSTLRFSFWRVARTRPEQIALLDPMLFVQRMHCRHAAQAETQKHAEPRGGTPDTDNIFF